MPLNVTQPTLSRTQPELRAESSSRGCSFQKGVWNLSWTYVEEVHQGESTSYECHEGSAPVLQQLIRDASQGNRNKSLADRCSHIADIRYALMHSFYSHEKQTGSPRSPAQIMGVANSHCADEESQQTLGGLLAARLIAAGFEVGKHYDFDFLGESSAPVIGEPGGFQGVRGLHRVLWHGINARQYKVAKLGAFNQAVHSVAREFLKLHEAGTGTTANMSEGEQLAHRARLLLLATPLTKLREHHALVLKVVKVASEYDNLGCEHRINPNAYHTKGDNLPLASKLLRSKLLELEAALN